jgi:mono/diheme cytochrome c family protein
MRRLIFVLALAGLVGGALFWLLTMPRGVDAARFANVRGNATAGARLFWAGGCASCHAAKGAKGDDRLRLGGGAPLVTAFGTFQPPNISPDGAAGIGGWQLIDFANAMQKGVDPEGRHLYPAFPYTSYARMTPADIADLFAYLRTLPPVSTAAPASSIGFPFNIRRGIGLWKLAFAGGAGPETVLPATASPAAHAGQYLVEGPGHCGVCHTPRTLGGGGGLDRARWLGGAPALEGKGRTPNITPAKAGIGSWSAADIASYLETGFTPDYDTVGGAMVEVQNNMARLTKADRDAIAAYLKAIPPVVASPLVDYEAGGSAVGVTTAS